MAKALKTPPMPTVPSASYGPAQPGGGGTSTTTKFHAAVHQQAYSDFYSYMQKKYPKINILDFIQAPTAAGKAAGFKDFSTDKAKENILATQLQHSKMGTWKGPNPPGFLTHLAADASGAAIGSTPIGALTHAGRAVSDLTKGDVVGAFKNSLRVVPGEQVAEGAVNAVHDAWNSIFGGGPQPKTYHLDHPQSMQIIKAAVTALSKQGVPTHDAINALSHDINPKTKTLDIKKAYKTTSQFMTANAIQKATAPSMVIDNFIKNELNPEVADRYQQKVNLYNQFTGYWSRKEAGLTGKKLGKDPLTGFSRSWLGIPTGQPITPELFQQAIQQEVNTKGVGDQFNIVMDKFKTMGISSQIQEIVQHQIMADNKLDKRPTTSLKGLFNSGQIDLKYILMAFKAYEDNPEITTTYKTQAGSGSTAAPNFKAVK